MCVWFCVLRLEKRGVKFYQRKIESFKEVSEGYSVIQLLVLCVLYSILLFLILGMLLFWACNSVTSRKLHSPTDSANCSLWRLFFSYLASLWAAGRIRGRRGYKLHWNQIRRAAAGSWPQTRPRSDSEGENANSFYTTCNNLHDGKILVARFSSLFFQVDAPWLKHWILTHDFSTGVYNSPYIIPG